MRMTAQILDMQTVVVQILVVKTVVAQILIVLSVVSPLRSAVRFVILQTS